jgi:formamidopyrimidine-DNA glycosylase
MPELPEVQTIVTELDRAVRGQRFVEVDVIRPDMIRTGAKPFAKTLLGRRIDLVDRIGKRAILRMSAGVEVIIHLGMSGRLTVEAPEAPLLPHTHLRMRTDKGREVRLRDPRRFGGVWLGNSNGSGPDSLGPLGPDALTIKIAQFREMLQCKRQIKALLLDQRIISGLGNIYCDESLFDAGIHPLRQAASISPAKVDLLARSISKTLKRAISAGGSTLRDYRRVDGSTGLFQISHKIYGREGQNCTRCKATILRIQAAGRSSHVCPRCQRLGA